MCMFNSVINQTTPIPQHWMYCLIPLCTYQCIAPGTTPRARVGDLTYMKSIASPLGRMLGSNAPLRTIYSPLLAINIDQIPLIWGMFYGQMRSNPHLLPVGGG